MSTKNEQSGQSNKLVKRINHRLQMTTLRQWTRSLIINTVNTNIYKACVKLTKHKVTSRMIDWKFEKTTTKLINLEQWFSKENSTRNSTLFSNDYISQLL